MIIFQSIQCHAWIKFLQTTVSSVSKESANPLLHVNTTCYLLLGIYLNYSKIFAYYKYLKYGASVFLKCLQNNCYQHIVFKHTHTHHEPCSQGLQSHETTYIISRNMYIKIQQLSIPDEVTCKVYLQSLVREELWKVFLAFSTTAWKKCPLSKIMAPRVVSSSKFMIINTSTISEITAGIPVFT